MKDTLLLPEDYKKAVTVDLSKDRKTMLTVNGAALALMIILLIAGHFFVPVNTLFELSFGAVMLRLCVMLAGTAVYMVLHELVHGIVIYLFSGIKPRYGFTGNYAYTGSDVYFTKAHYITIALAPIVVWGIVLQLLINFAVPEDWFWPVWFIQVSNLSGAAGDLFVTIKFLKLPSDILVQDTGVSMTVFTREK